MKKLMLLSLSAALLVGCTMGGISNEKAQTIADDFIKTVLAPGANLNIKSVEKVSGDFKIIVEAEGQEVISYLSSDGKIFYPQGLDIASLKIQMAESKKMQEKAIPVESDGGIGDGAEPLDEILEEGKVEQSKEIAVEAEKTETE